MPSTPSKVAGKGERNSMKAHIKKNESDEEATDTITVNAQRSPSPASDDPVSAAAADENGDEGHLSLGHEKSNGATQPAKHGDSASQSPDAEDNSGEEVVGGEITVKMEPGQQPKLARTSSQKVAARSVQLFDHLPDKTPEAVESFQLISECVYSAKYLGLTEHAMECDCAEEWDPATKTNQACGEESDCINRATKMECIGDCGCGTECQNQRFQRQQYASVAVIMTDKKGYGLRSQCDLQPNEFIYEYVGEVIHEGQFRKRMLQYDDEGIRHFYFMSLNKGEFVDATKRGNLGRFCNHSCNPNCYVDKWVVGDKLRMGIFALRKIRAGEELVFNYNVDRYGADPQPCYCGEPNCTGYIGGKTQTERATKLSNATIEALGIDDGDSWDTAVAKRPRKKKTGEDDEEYINNVQPKSLDEDGVTKVMATLMQCKEKWIAVKLLGRIQRCSDERVISRVVKMHGYQILNSSLITWKEDSNVVLQILEVLDKFPRLTKNKISDSKIEETVSSLQGYEDDRVEARAMALIQEWSTLETAYRIPRKKRDPNVTQEVGAHFDRRGEDRKRQPRSRSRSRSPTRSRSRSLDAPKGPSAPTGPRSNVPQRYQGPRPPFRPPPRNFNALPPGWFSAIAQGRTYYYSSSGATTWIRPVVPATQPPPPPPKPPFVNKALDDIISEITSANAKAKATDKPSSAATPQGSGEGKKLEAKKDGQEKWRELSEEKQKKIYENTLFPHVKHVVDKYKHKLPRDDIKRFFKEISKKLVNSDFKNNRVADPTKISEKQEKVIKKFVKEFFDKVVAKKKAHEDKKAEIRTKVGRSSLSPSNAKAAIKTKPEESSDKEMGMDLSEGEAREQTTSLTPATPFEQLHTTDGLKRKREEDIEPDSEVEIATPGKRARSLTPATPFEQPHATDGLKRKREEDSEPDSEVEISTPGKRARSLTPPAPPPPPPPPAEDELEGYDHGAFGQVQSPVTNGVEFKTPEADAKLTSSPLLSPSIKLGSEKGSFLDGKDMLGVPIQS